MKLSAVLCECGHSRDAHSGHTVMVGQPEVTHCSQADGCRAFRIRSMPDGRSCRFVVVRFGYLIRGEHMNIGVLCWEHNAGPDASVLQQLLTDWTRILQAFPGSGADGWVKDEVLGCLGAVKTYGDYERVLSKMGPYTPFEFSEEKGSLAFPEDTLAIGVEHFLSDYGQTLAISFPG